MRHCFYLEPLEPRLTLSAGFLAAHGVPGGAIFLDLGNDVGYPQFFFQPDGKFIATDNLPDYGPGCPGEWKEYEGKRFFARFNPDGSRDLTYGDNGAVNYPCLEDDFDIFLQQGNGKILAVTDSGGVARFTAGGRLDPFFNSTDSLPIPFDAGYSVSEQIAFASDGKILLAGQVWPVHNKPGFDHPSASILFLLRLNSDGTLDRSFGDGGAASREYVDAFGWASGLAVQRDGKILVATGDHSDVYGRKEGSLLRFNPDGTPDEDFASHGQFHFDPQEFGGPILLQPDGKIIVELAQGDYASPSAPDMTLLRLTPEGTLDNSFGVDGSSRSSWHGHNSWDKFFIQPDRKILAIENDGIVARFTSTGVLDPTFGFGGSMLLATSDSSLDFTVDDASLRPDGHLLLLLQQDNCWGDCDEFSEYLADITTDSTQPSQVSSADGSLIIQPFTPESVTVPPSADPAIIRQHTSPESQNTRPSESFDRPSVSDKLSAPDSASATANLLQDSDDPLAPNDPDSEFWLD